MKTCKTVNGLIKSIKKNEHAILPIWGIMDNNHSEGGAYLNLGQGQYSYVGKENWQLIRNFVVDASNNNISYKDRTDCKRFFK